LIYHQCLLLDVVYIRLNLAVTHGADNCRCVNQRRHRRLSDERKIRCTPTIRVFCRILLQDVFYFLMNPLLFNSHHSFTRSLLRHLMSHLHQGYSIYRAVITA